MSLFWFLTISLIPLTNALCYTPAGNLSNDVPCNADAPASVCCTAGFLCMSNGLCQPAQWWKDNSQKFIRGTCTDKTWRASQCGGYCVTENPTGGEWVMACGSRSNASTEWCCGFEDCCNKDSTRLLIGEASITATAGVTTTSVSSRTSVSTSASSSTSSVPSAVTSEAQHTTASSATATPAASTAGRKGGLGVALGVGLGVGITTVLILSAGLLLLSRRRRNFDQSDKHYKQHYELSSEPKPMPAELQGS